MAEKQGHLNGAYYGPSIPPSRGYRSVGRGSGCNPFSCLLCTLFKFIITIVVFIGIVILVLWLLFRPHNIKVHIPEANLKQFNLNNNTNLQYNLNLTVVTRNPNKRLSLYYDYIEADAYYDDNRFAFVDNITSFYQGTKTTNTFDVDFVGSKALDSSSLSTTYNKEKSDGYYNVELKIRTNLRLKVWWFKIHYDQQKIDCSLKLPLPGSSNTYEDTGCDVHVF